MKRRTLFLWLGLAIAALPSKGLAQDGTRSERIGGGAQTAAENEGIQRYVFAGVAVDSFNIDQWSDLANAVNDLRGVRSVLRDRYGFVSPEDWILTNASATQDGIGELLDRLDDDSTGVREGDALVFFFAGHGTEHNGRGFLVPHDVTKAITQGQSQYVGIAQLVERLSDLPAQHVLLILDSCKSGLALTAGDGLKDQVSAAEMEQLIEEMARNKSRLVVTSAASSQPAADGNGPLAGHSLFTGYLIEGLERAAQGNIPPDSLETERGRLVTTELFGYVQERVATAAASAQTPTFGAFMARGETGDYRGQLVLAFDVNPFDDAYEEAIRYSESDQDQRREFRDAFERALELEDEESEAPRAWYLRYLEATLEGEEDVAESVIALRRLQAYATDGVPLPAQLGGRAIVVRLLREAEKGCTRDPICVAATSAQ